MKRVEKLLRAVARRLPHSFKKRINRAARKLPQPIRRGFRKVVPTLGKVQSVVAEPADPATDVLSGELYTNRIAIQDLVNKLNPADVVSFDIFDTLIFRPFRDPKDVFSVLEVELDRPGFRESRIRAEREARDVARAASRGVAHEVTLRDIYEHMHRIDGIDIETGMQAELAAECRYVKPNPYMLEVVHSLIASEKKIAFTSDMYLSAEQIRSLLLAAGIDLDVPLFVSSEYGISKRNGGLFDIVKEHFAAGADGPLSFAHVGDNYPVDVESAQAHGFDAHWYKNIHALSEPAWRHSGQVLRTSATLGLIDIKFGNVTDPQGDPLNCYALGYRYAGPLTLAFVDWIAAQAKALDLDQIVFLSRDGYVPHAVYEMLGESIPSCYLPWSRAIGLTAGAASFKSEWIRQFVSRAAEAGFTSVQELLDALQIQVEPELLAAYRDRLDESSADSLARLFQDHWDVVLPQIEAASARTRQAVETKVTGRRVGIVDIGYAGTGVFTLRSLLSDRYVHGFHFGSFRNQRFAALIEDGVIESFAFGAENNFAVRNTHAKRPLFNNTLLEVLMGAPYPSVTGFAQEQDGISVELGADRPDEHEATREIIAGALDYVADFRSTFSEGVSLRGMSGGTAAALYLELERNSLVRELLQDVFPGKFEAVPVIRKGKS